MYERTQAKSTPARNGEHVCRPLGGEVARFLRRPIVLPRAPRLRDPVAVTRCVSSKTALSEPERKAPSRCPKVGRPPPENRENAR